MIGEVLQIGDIVSVVIDKENREWGYNPVPDGTLAKVVGFATITYGRIRNYGFTPGVYENRSWIKLETLDAEKKQWSEWTGRLTMVDQNAYNERLAEYRKIQAIDWRLGTKRIGDLPETEFWEGDVVTNDELTESFRDYTNVPEYTPGVFYIDHIKWEYMGMMCDDGITPMPIYGISPLKRGGIYTSTFKPLKLVERGNVWKYFHNEPLSFASIAEEAAFHQDLGLYTEVKNPATDKYSFTKEEALDALRTGIGHGISVSSGMFGSSPMTHVMKFNDEELGKRVIAETLKGFSSESTNEKADPVGN